MVSMTFSRCLKSGFRKLPLKRTKTWTVLLCICVAALVFPHASPAMSDDVSAISPQKRAALGVAALQSWYNEQTGLYNTTGWWNSANAITTLADYSRISGSHHYEAVFYHTFTQAQKTAPGFLNKFYDDEGWWALAWIDVYDLTHQPKYLQMAQSIFTDMAGGWSDDCSGGIWWSKDRKYKNAIANELFLSVAAHLATRATTGSDRKKYLSWARREWQWFAKSGMINADHLVNDGLDAKCQNNHATTWSYNQGVILGGLAELYRVRHDRKLLDMAGSIAGAAISAPALVDAHGILHESCEPKCGDDGSQFKGIFARNLEALDEVSPATAYSRFITTNAESVWSGGRPPDYRLGLIWSAPYGASDANASTQSSALDVLVAAFASSSRNKAAADR
jgi:predicted alpha-1,6-mannanase (GH76 family)